MMTRMIHALSALALLVSAGVASAEPAAVAPLVGTFTEADVAAARARRNATPPSALPEWEEGDCVSEIDADLYQGELRQESDEDNDSIHYGRGSVLVLHLFIDHPGGSWSETERHEAGIKAMQAKDYYLTNAPPEAGLHFDFEGSTGYFYFVSSVEDTITGSTDFRWDQIDEALENLGWTDTDGDGYVRDEFSLYYQGWGLGWDNVIVSAQPADVTGGATASYSFGTTRQYTDDPWEVWTHEWGHLFGACDEYDRWDPDNGVYTCNSGMDCGDCQSWYLTEVVANGNCELPQCGTPVSCLMRGNNETNGSLCAFTPKHWGWVDSDLNGLLDDTRRRLQGDSFVRIREVPEGGHFIWDQTIDGMSVTQITQSWNVIGLRSYGNADYDLRVFEDNNHNHPRATCLSGYDVDFVVADYNSRIPGVDHIQVEEWAGGDDYILTFDEGSGMLFPDGLDHSLGWGWNDVAEIYDVPLFGGETITFTLDVVSGDLDMGMALFRADGVIYYGNRFSPEWLRDAGSSGVSESFTYTVPEDDVYGLVLFSNTQASGTIEVQIGPSPVILAEEEPFASTWDLRLFRYTPNSFYWLFAGTRPESATDVEVGLFAEQTYETELERSDGYGPSAVEFVAIDYRSQYSTDWLRVLRTSGTGLHRTEWEQDPEILNGVETTYWDFGHVGKMWDVGLSAGQTYFFRQYNGSGDLDGGIYLFDSVDGDRYHERSDFAHASNFRPAADGGEWFSYTAPTDDWYGYAMIVNDEAVGNYGVAFGPRETLADGAPVTFDAGLIWGEIPMTSGYWHVVGVRAQADDEASVAVWECSDYGSDCFLTSTARGRGARFMAMDFNHASSTTYYPRGRREIGSGEMDMSFEAGNEAILFDPDGATAAGTWTEGEVARVWDLFVDGGATGGQDVRIEVTPSGGTMDLGVAVLSSFGTSIYQDLEDAVATADVTGPGETEVLEVTLTDTDWYGLVVYAQNDEGGTFEIEVRDSEATVSTDVGSMPAEFGLRSRAANPLTGPAMLEFTMVESGPAALQVFDVHGRLVRTLVNGPVTTGHHTAVWDRRDDVGRLSAPGMYLVRLRAGSSERVIKLMHAR